MDLPQTALDRVTLFIQALDELGMRDSPEIADSAQSLKDVFEELDIPLTLNSILAVHVGLHFQATMMNDEIDPRAILVLASLGVDVIEGRVDPPEIEDEHD